MGYDVAGLDVMPEAVEHAARRGIDDIRLHDLAQPWPFDDASVRAVVLLDVLEHMEDPVAVLRHAKRAMAADGAIVFTVPAYGWLMSDWDVKLGHFRRYSGRMLRQQALEAGLDVVRLSHWNAFTLPPAIVMRLMDRVRNRNRPAEFPRVSSLVNSMLLGCANVERAWLRHLPVPAGLSLVGVLRKREGEAPAKPDSDSPGLFMTNSTTETQRHGE